MLNLVNPSLSVRPEEIRLSLDEIAREGARRMLIRALQAEVTDYIDLHQDLRDEDGHRLGRSSRQGPGEDRSRSEVARSKSQAPRVRDRREGERFSVSDPARVHAQVPEGREPASDPVPEGALHRRLPLGAH